LANTSKEHPCRQLLEHCLRGEAWPAALLDRAIEEDDGRALLSIVVERLGDLFEPRLSEVYRRLFTEVIERAAPELRERIRRPQIPHQVSSAFQAQRVYLLSRVTLGADVAVTSVLIDAAKRRFPDAEIIFVGPRKSYEMFDADARIAHFDVPYARAGSLRERLRASVDLWIDDGIVIDPDSRLTQLGVISVCDPDRYFHFESRSFGADSAERLPALASRWAHEALGVENARAYVAPLQAEGEPPAITMSLGVGENPAKRIGGDFEISLLAALRTSGKLVLIDKGGSPEERERVEQLVNQSGLPNVRTHDGSFAHFAAQVARSQLYVGYDSAGGHVASACGVQVISIFAGAVSDRFLSRWRPVGTVINGDTHNPSEVIGEVQRALSKELASRRVTGP
jgi:ADP-heptose:LPS heptosyltransferase